MNWFLLLIILISLADIVDKISNIQKDINNLNYKLGDIAEDIKYISKFCNIDE
jgi:hypothetical protein